MPYHDPLRPVRWLLRAVPEATNAAEVLRAPCLPLGFVGVLEARHHFRDVYLDTEQGLLERRGLRCRMRHALDGRTLLTVWWGEGESGRADRLIVDARPGSILDTEDQLSRTLRALIDPARLVPVLGLQVARALHSARWKAWPVATVLLALDEVRADGPDPAAEWLEIGLAEASQWGLFRRRFVKAVVRAHDLKSISASPLARAREVAESQERTTLAAGIRAPHEVGLLLLSGDQIGLIRQPDGLRIPRAHGEGEHDSRRLLEETFGTPQGQFRRLGVLPARPWRHAIDIWLARRLPAQVRRDPQLTWLSLARAIELAGSPALRDVRTLGALQLAAQSDLRRESEHVGLPSASSVETAWPNATRIRSDVRDDERYLDADLSLLEFNARVLALARDESGAPIRRLEYLAIVASNLDEFFMVRVGALKHALHSASHEGEESAGSAARLDAIRLRAHALHMAVFHEICSVVRPQLEAHGVRLRRWGDLDNAERQRLGALFEREIVPRLHPFASGPRHPFPHLASSTTALAVTLRDPASGARRVAILSIPVGVPRAIPLANGSEWILVEELVCTHSALVFPGLELLRAHLFRVTRSADVRYEEASETDALRVVAQAVERRPFLPVVRLEVDRRMPADQRSRLVQEFRFETPDRVSDLEEHDVVEIDDLMSLHGLREIVATMHVRVPLPRRSPFGGGESVFASIRARDVLAHFPYDAFDDTVVRFLDEAASDPAVESVQLTLYRTSEQSTVLAALDRARGAGKTVIVYVELKARFDESRNMEAAERLRAAGIQVIYGAATLKVHAKLLLVVRREGDGPRRYAYIGSGNFNPVTATRYTDVGLFTARAAVTRDVDALLQALSGARGWPSFGTLLVSPSELLPRVLALISQEALHARLGRPAGIRLKLNGLDDVDVVEALYRASAAGVRCELIVRGLCTLRPGVPGLSENIRVVSILGEFLEHARILHFVNGGAHDYYIGSADLRERNMRRRVEVLAPVTDADHRARLGTILDVELRDPTAWQLAADGRWAQERSRDDAGGAQGYFRHELLDPTAASLSPATDDRFLVV